MTLKSDVRFTSVKFRNFKAFRNFSVSLRDLNILVGANNCGKSTILSAFRVLAAGLRGARARRPDHERGPDGLQRGYRIPRSSIPISMENVQSDYAEVDARVDFRLSNGNVLTLYFPMDGGCILFPENHGRLPKTPSGFKKDFPVSVGVVPVLGPVEHEEQLVREETVKREVATHRAARHFRNYWRYNSDGFEKFAELVERTWPGMAIQEPEKPEALADYLVMFCSEDRIDRELYWAGFGFQVWCQLLTHIIRSSTETILIVDEPEIYLHPDLQRQLLGIVRDSPPDVLLATHSSEIMAEADPSELIYVDKTRQSGLRLKDVEGLQKTLDSIGSVQNITLTQLARTRRVLFVEGKSDFSRIRRFSSLLGLDELAAGIGLTSVHSGGFSTWEKIENLAWGIREALGAEIKIGVILDRDYRPEEEIVEIEKKLRSKLTFAWIFRRKEIENYLLDPSTVEKAFQRALGERANRTGESVPETATAGELLVQLSNGLRTDALSQYISRRVDFFKSTGLDPSTITSDAVAWFEERWGASLASRMEIAPGKDLLRLLRREIQERWSVNLTDVRLIDAHTRDQIPEDLRMLLEDLEVFRTGS